MGKAAAPEVARLLLEYGRRTALAGGNPYRAKAYLRAAESLAAQTEPLDLLIDEDRLREIPGVGVAIADIITKLHRTGTHPSLEKMRAEIPDGVLDLLSIPVIKLYRELGIKTVDKLEGRRRRTKSRASKASALRFSARSFRGSRSGGTRKARGTCTARKGLKRSGLALSQIVPAGDFRRGNELVANLALVAQADVQEAGLSGSRAASLRSSSPTQSVLASACCWQRVLRSTCAS